MLNFLKSHRRVDRQVASTEAEAGSRPPEPPGSPGEPRAARQPAGYRVLIADDCLTNRFVLDAAVRRCGLSTVQAEDGAEAMKLFEEHDDLRLILLDWMMPNWSGLEVCQWIRKQPRGEQVYIILVTARSQREDLRAGLANGADEFLTKPVDPAELELRIKAGVRLLDMQVRLEANVARLEQALSEVSTLRTLIPMCMHCKNVRDDQGYWDAVDTYLGKHHTEMSISHGICPTCYAAEMERLDAELNAS